MNNHASKFDPRHPFFIVAPTLHLEMLPVSTELDRTLHSEDFNTHSCLARENSKFGSKS